MVQPSDTDPIATVSITTDEQLTRRASPETAARAVELFREFGFVRLENVYSQAAISVLEEHYRRRYRNYLKSSSKEDRRPLFTVDVEGPFNDPAVYANALVFPLVKQFLGEDCILGSMSSVVSFPGAPDQFLHRDSRPIFGKDYTTDVTTPPYAMTVLIPFVDCNLETGCTKVWPRTHRCATDEAAMRVSCVDPEVKVGSVLITDSRLLHRGGANQSARVRPLLYLTYHRSWFRDFWGYETRPPVSISYAQLRRVPAEHRHLFTWMRDRYRTVTVLNSLRRIVPPQLLELGKGLRRSGAKSDRTEGKPVS